MAVPRFGKLVRGDDGVRTDDGNHCRIAFDYYHSPNADIFAELPANVHSCCCLRYHCLRCRHDDDNSDICRFYRNHGHHCYHRSPADDTVAISGDLYSFDMVTV